LWYVSQEPDALACTARGLRQHSSGIRSGRVFINWFVASPFFANQFFGTKQRFSCQFARRIHLRNQFPEQREKPNERICGRC
jgi:hypothetical protein